jgi:PHD/YefM family antitoxin component YafN of YafNO toxin-antitoxin module
MPGTRGEHMRIIGLTEAKDKPSSIIEETKNNPTVITKNGKTAAILIVPEDDADLERLLLSRSQTLQDVLGDAARRSNGAKRSRSRKRSLGDGMGLIKHPFFEYTSPRIKRCI